MFIPEAIVEPKEIKKGILSVYSTFDKSFHVWKCAIENAEYPEKKAIVYTCMTE